MSNMPPEIQVIQRQIEDLLSRCQDLVLIPKDDHDYLDDELPKETDMLVLTGWVLSVEYTNMSAQDSGENWTTCLASHSSGRAQRIGLASIALDRYSE